MLSLLKKKNIYSIVFILLFWVFGTSYISFFKAYPPEISIIDRFVFALGILINAGMLYFIYEKLDSDARSSLLPSFLWMAWGFWLSQYLTSLVSFYLLNFFIFSIFFLLLLQKKNLSLGTFFIFCLFLNYFIVYVPEWFFIYLFIGLSVFFIKRNIQFLFVFIFSYLFLSVYQISYAYLFDLPFFQFTESLVPDHFCFQLLTPFVVEHSFVFYFIFIFLLLHPIFFHFGFWTTQKINAQHMGTLTTFFFVFLFNLVLACSWNYTDAYYLIIGLYFPIVFSYIAYHFKFRWVMEIWLLIFLLLLFFF